MTAYVSCQADLLYGDGGFYDTPQLLLELRKEGHHADFITDAGELFPSFACTRPVDAGRLFGGPVFIEKLLAHYAWINVVFGRGAATRVVKLTNVYLHQNILYVIAGEEVRTVYETDRPNDRPSRRTTAWAPGHLRSSALKMRYDHPCLYLGSAGWFNYGHWLIDDLPRAGAINAIERHAGSSRVDIILPGFAPALNMVKEQCLSALEPGRQSGSICFVPPNQPLHFDELYFVTPVSYHPTLKSPDACQLLRTLGRSSLAAFVVPNASDGRKVYITRARVHGRDIVNQTKVTGTFQAFGFTIVDVEGMTFAQQVAAVKDARIVAGCMGATMTNTVFCEPGTIVLHLAPEGWMEPFYWDLASTCGHSYAALFGPPTDPLVAPHLSAFTIDVRQLADVLSQLVAGL